MSNNSRVVEVGIIGRNATATAVNSRVSQTTVQSVNPYLALTPPGGSDGQIQYNSNNGFAGASGFYYDNSLNQVRLVNGKLLLNNSNLSINGINNTGTFLITDNSVDVLKIDTSNKRILLGQNSNYYIGIGITNPTEKVHISGGNLRVEGTGYFSDLFVNGQRISSQSFTTGINTGNYYQDIIFPTSFSSPKVNYTLYNTDPNQNYIYGSSITNITSTGFRIEFTDTIRETGNFLNVLIN